MNKKLLVIVTGMHRSGTSALAGAIHKMGIPMTVDGFINPGPDNPEGFYEDREALGINKRILAESGGDWQTPPDTISPSRETRGMIRNLLAKAEKRGASVFGFKDPRFCVTFPIWARLAKDRGLSVAMVTIRRSQASVVKSLTARNGGNETKWKALIRAYSQIRSRQLAAGLLRGETFDIGTFAGFVKDAEGALVDLAEWIRGTHPEIESHPNELRPDVGAQAINRDLIHHGTAKRRA